MKFFGITIFINLLIFKSIDANSTKFEGALKQENQFLILVCAGRLVMTTGIVIHPKYALAKTEFINPVDVKDWTNVCGPLSVTKGLVDITWLSYKDIGVESPTLVPTVAATDIVNVTKPIIYYDKHYLRNDPYIVTNDIAVIILEGLGHEFIPIVIGAGAISANASCRYVFYLGNEYNYYNYTNWLFQFQGKIIPQKSCDETLLASIALASDANEKDKKMVVQNKICFAPDVQYNASIGFAATGGQASGPLICDHKAYGLQAMPLKTELANGASYTLSFTNLSSLEMRTFFSSFAQNDTSMFEDGGNSTKSNSIPMVPAPEIIYLSLLIITNIFVIVI